MISINSTNSDIILGSIVYISENILFGENKIRSGSVGVVTNINLDEIYVNFLGDNITTLCLRNNLLLVIPNEYGDGKENKICNMCHRVLKTIFFDKNQNGINNRTVRRPSCVDCRKLVDGKGVQRIEKKIFEKTKPFLEVFSRLICEKTTIPGLTSKVVLNHDHSTGKVTGWICDSCNTGLGRFKDDIKILKKAIKYLKEN